MNTKENSDDRVWVAAEYHMPIVYSCRAPISSPVAGHALPAPSPATVQLALIRVGIELYGYERTRDELFHHIVSCSPRIRPPSRIALSEHLMKLYKADGDGRIIEGLGYRQVAHCHDTVTVFASVDNEKVDDLCALLSGIGYWGKANSFAVCVGIKFQAPQAGTYAQRLEELASGMSGRDLYVAFASELDLDSITWERVTSVSPRSAGSAVHQRLYVWPLQFCERQSSGVILEYCSLLPA